MVGTRVRLALLLLAAPITLGAQSVRGQLTDSITKTPLPGAFMTLVDDDGFERVRTITNSTGEFLLTAPAPGSYRLRSKRIGFRPYLSAPLELRAGTPQSFDVAIDPIPVALSSVVVKGERLCDVSTDSTGASSVTAVWQEIREALAGIAWTSRLTDYWYDIAHFQRDVTASGRRQSVRPDSLWREVGYQRVPIKSAPPEDLVVRGYVIEEADSGRTYRGPDADVLMSGPFLRTHCFETTAGKDETAGLIGLAFTPVRGRRLSDIEGTVWLDKKSAQLRQVDYTYKHLPDDFVAPRAGGHIEFLRLPSGTWIVSNWVIRMPLTVVKQRVMAMGDQIQVVGYRETGGNLVEVKTSGGAIVYRSDSAAATLTTVASRPSPVADLVPPSLAPALAPAGPVDEPAVAPPAPKSRIARQNANVITADDLAQSSAIDVYAVIQELRPLWLRSRGQISLDDPTSGNVHAYLHGERLGEVSELRHIATRDVREIRFYTPAQAEMKFGSGNAGGVIDITLKVN